MAGEPPVLPGDLIDGKFRVEAVLGRGGMGVVVRAFHEQLGRSVAIKFLLPEMLKDSGVVQRFEREARATARLKNEHIVDVLDVGRLANGAPYIVMELLDGENLASLLYRSPLSDAEIVEIMLQICDGVGEAHAHGIVHRDLKPQNIQVGRRRDGRLKVKVLDFGISKMAEASVLTGTNDMLGSPHYMSPEQLLTTRDVTPASDVWALGIILYELVTRTKPFSGETLAAVCMQIIQTPHVPVPTRLGPIIDRCLAKTPAERFASVDELATALRGAPISAPALLSSSPSMATRIDAPATVPHVPTAFRATVPDPIPAALVAAHEHHVSEPNATAWGATHARRRASRPWLPVLAIGVAALFLGGGAVGVQRLRQGRAAPPPTTSSSPVPALPPAAVVIPTSVASEPPPPPVPVASGAPSASAVPTAVKPSRPRPTAHPAASEDPDQLPTLRR